MADTLTQRLTAKAGPLPVWAWALLILLVGYLIYRRRGAGTSSSSDTGTTSDTSPAPQTDQSTGGNPGPDQTVQPDVGQLNDSLLSQLSGFQGSLDALTAAVLSSEAFQPGGGDAGSGSQVPNGSTPAGPAVAAKHAQPSKQAAPTQPKKKRPAKTPPRPRPRRPTPQLVSEHGRWVR